MKKIAVIFVSLFLIAIPSMKTFAQDVSVTATIAPPALPYYDQPDCPVDGYIWTPGYWAYDDVDGYYWVPGVWVAPPEDGYYWTPPYWDYSGGYYGWHEGYWGLTVGFYGGINYGYGYGGYGYGGGRWDGGHFRYNTAITHVNTNVVHNVYVDKTITNGGSHISFHGPGGITRQPRPEEQAAARGPHVSATSEQHIHQQTAVKDHNQFASVNHGKPGVAAMDKVGGNHFATRGAAHGGMTTPTTHPANNTFARPATGQHLHTQHVQQPAVQHMQPQMQQHTQQPVQHMQPQHIGGGGQPHMGGGGGGQHMGGGGGHTGGGGRR
jgi:WXXGXW repeat (2 copies)